MTNTTNRITPDRRQLDYGVATGPASSAPVMRMTGMHGPCPISADSTSTLWVGIEHYAPEPVPARPTLWAAPGVRA